MMTRFISLLMGLTSLFITACGNNENSEENYTLPPIYISCNQGFADDCRTSNDNKDFYVGISSDTAIDCEIELTNVIDANLDLYFEFYGSSKTTIAGELEGIVTQWYDTENQQTYYMQNIEYKACAFIDANENKKLDPTEAVGELLFDANDNFPTIIDWQ